MSERPCAVTTGTVSAERRAPLLMERCVPAALTVHDEEGDDAPDIIMEAGELRSLFFSKCHVFLKVRGKVLPACDKCTTVNGVKVLPSCLR